MVIKKPIVVKLCTKTVLPNRLWMTILFLVFFSLSLLSYRAAQTLYFSLAFLSLAEDGVVCTFAFGGNGKRFEILSFSLSRFSFFLSLSLAFSLWRRMAWFALSHLGVMWSVLRVWTTTLWRSKITVAPHMEAENHGSVAFGGRKSRWQCFTEVPDNWWFFFLFSFISFLFALFFLSLQMFLFDKDCVGIYSWGFWGLWVLLLFSVLYCAGCLSVLMLQEWFWVLTKKVGAWGQCQRSINFRYESENQKRKKKIKIEQ